VQHGASTLDAAIVPAADHAPAMDHDGADGNPTFGAAPLGFGDSRAHEFVRGHQNSITCDVQCAMCNVLTCNVLTCDVLTCNVLTCNVLICSDTVAPAPGSRASRLMAPNGGGCGDQPTVSWNHAHAALDAGFGRGFGLAGGRETHHAAQALLCRRLKQLHEKIIRA
jgi:hypothetical protein